MSYVSREQLFVAREMDLLTYLRRFEPQELVYKGGNVYSTRTHDSLKISNGKWCWWSRNIGGKNALDYLTKVEGVPFLDAVQRILGAAPTLPATPEQAAPVSKTEFALPPKHADNRRVFSYLHGRGIAPEIINHCIKTGQLYEDGQRHNCVFVGFEGELPRYATLRGTLSEKRFMGEVPGSDTQCFQELYYWADEKYNGRLPVPVRVIQDEWANVAQPDSYPKILATCRSYNIGLNIIVQNIQNIKALYEKEWEGIIGNCDTLLFLGGGNEPTSLEFMSKLLGKETLDTRTRGQTKGRNGSSSTNYQQAGRELMMIDEIRMMDTDDAILLIRGEKPVLDKKYDITRHPNFKKSAAGGVKPYVHKPQEAPDYALPDLPYEFHALDDYEFIDMEDSQNEQEE